ncbi:MAG: hypothetical protein BWX76_00003 [Candidatus Cloacimonetes bacterium ADurb.Bin089]|nr:MAG: hypothetical protein BWX76_00003 [Candidatus Cloacimonetes bacterium ADurb.Bin089]
MDKNPAFVISTDRVGTEVEEIISCGFNIGGIEQKGSIKSASSHINKGFMNIFRGTGKNRLCC